MVTYATWVRYFLPKIGCKRIPLIGYMSKHRTRAMYCWMYAEGHGGRFNPLNSTLQKPGSVTINSAGVQSYVSFEQGVEATAETLNYGADRNVFGYRKIRRRLRINAPAKYVLAAIEDSKWGTGGLALRVLKENGKSNIDGYAERLIDQ